MSRDGPGIKVYVGNLDERCTKRDLEEFFDRHMPVLDMWIARRPPGFGFVFFEQMRDAERAVRDLDGRDMKGRRIRVEISSGKRRGDRGGDRDRGRSRSPDRRRRSRSPPRRDDRSPPRRDDRSPPRRDDRDRRDERKEEPKPKSPEPKSPEHNGAAERVRSPSPAARRSASR